MILEHSRLEMLGVYIGVQAVGADLLDVVGVRVLRVLHHISGPWPFDVRV